jgi:hypothetical protein
MTENLENIGALGLETLKKAIASVYNSDELYLRNAFEAVREEYGEGFGNHHLADLFSEESYDRFNPVAANEPNFDAENESWKRHQIKNITQLCVELSEAGDEHAKEAIAYDLIDYLVNV